MGFPRRDEEKLLTALENTHALFWIRATRQSKWAKVGQLLGFARATSDGVFNAVIWDVAVRTSFLFIIYHVYEVYWNRYITNPKSLK